MPNPFDEGMVSGYLWGMSSLVYNSGILKSIKEVFQDCMQISICLLGVNKVLLGFLHSLLPFCAPRTWQGCACWCSRVPHRLLSPSKNSVIYTVPSDCRRQDKCWALWLTFGSCTSPWWVGVLSEKPAVSGWELACTGTCSAALGAALLLLNVFIFPSLCIWVFVSGSSNNLKQRLPWWWILET